MLSYTILRLDSIMIILQEDRNRIRCATLLKATVKSYIIRRKLKDEQRKLFDTITSAQPSDDGLNQLITKIVFFYDPNEDLNRLVNENHFYRCTVEVQYFIEFYDRFSSRKNYYKGRN